MSNDPGVYRGSAHTESDLFTLYERLDALWIRHLNLLHEYTAAQAAVTKHLAAGFFSLAQANFKSSGRRYGRDSYDERARAITRVQVEVDDDSLQLQVRKYGTGQRHDSSIDSEPSLNTLATLSQSTSTAKHEKSTVLPSPSPTPEPEPHVLDSSEKHETAATEAENTGPHVMNSVTLKASTPELENSTTNIIDPIKWFGILLPPTLRSAQASFSAAVCDDDCVAKAINAARGLREVEIEIRKVRKALKKMEKEVRTSMAESWS